MYGWNWDGTTISECFRYIHFVVAKKGPNSDCQAGWGLIQLAYLVRVSNFGWNAQCTSDLSHQRLADIREIQQKTNHLRVQQIQSHVEVSQVWETTNWTTKADPTQAGELAHPKQARSSEFFLRRRTSNSRNDKNDNNDELIGVLYLQ